MPFVKGSAMMTWPYRRVEGDRRPRIRHLQWAPCVLMPRSIQVAKGRPIRSKHLCVEGQQARADGLALGRDGVVGVSGIPISQTSRVCGESKDSEHPSSDGWLSRSQDIRLEPCCSYSQ